jgi:hypothetical protein
MSISSLFYYLQFHKKPSFSWNWSFITSPKSKEDIFSIYSDDKDHQIKKIKKSYNLIIQHIHDFNTKEIKQTLRHLHLNSTLIYHLHFQSSDIPFDQIIDFIYILKEHFKDVLIYRSQWALTKNECFIISSHFTKKSKKISKEKIEKSVKECFIDILTQYQFEIEKNYFIYHSEKKLKESQHEKISQQMIQQNKNWCRDVGIHKPKNQFYNI